jgi:TPR repeat protein
LRRAADGGHPAALARCALALLDGPSPDRRAALAYLARLAAVGGREHSVALFRYGMLLLDGAAGDERRAEGIPFVRDAARAGDVGARVRYAEALRARRDRAAAFYFARAAAAGDELGRCRFAECLLKGDGVPRNAERAVAILRECTAPEAAFRLGIALWKGDGVEKDREEAIVQMRAAATAGVARAQFRLAKFTGDVEKLRAAAFAGLKKAVTLLATMDTDFLRLAVEIGDDTAEIGTRIAEGRGIAKDLVEAERFLERAKSPGKATAVLATARALMGKGGEVDAAGLATRGVELFVSDRPGEAGALLERAADMGDPAGMNNWAVLLALRKNGAAARGWLERAVAAGSPTAMDNLAYALENGIGGPVDVERAAELYAMPPRLGLRAPELSLRAVAEREAL